MNSRIPAVNVIPPLGTAEAPCGALGAILDHVISVGSGMRYNGGPEDVEGRVCTKLRRRATRAAAGIGIAIGIFGGRHLFQRSVRKQQKQQNQRTMLQSAGTGSSSCGSCVVLKGTID